MYVCTTPHINLRFWCTLKLIWLQTSNLENIVDRYQDSPPFCALVHWFIYSLSLWSGLNQHACVVTLWPLTRLMVCPIKTRGVVSVSPLSVVVVGKMKRHCLRAEKRMRSDFLANSIPVLWGISLCCLSLWNGRLMLIYTYTWLHVSLFFYYCLVCNIQSSCVLIDSAVY